MSKKPPKLRPGDIANFETLKRAHREGALALLSAIRKSDQQPVALVCAMEVHTETGQTTILPKPLAVMIEGNPYELFEDPTDGEEDEAAARPPETDPNPTPSRPPPARH